MRDSGKQIHKDTAGDIVSKIGEMAGVKVHTHPTSGKVKYASAHDLRRSFADRWSRLVMPSVLQELMRHESIDTAMRYYVDRNAESTADDVWSAHERNVSGDTLGVASGRNRLIGDQKKKPQAHLINGLAVSRRGDSNSRPAHYECAALPTELQRLTY